MSTGFFNVPTPNNEPVKSYAPGSEEEKQFSFNIKHTIMMILISQCILMGKKYVREIP